MEESRFDLETRIGITELWLHYLWKEKMFFDFNCATEDGKELKIRSAGWYNRGWGPDFKEARIQIGENELFGDIEIHIEESSWRKHGHNEDGAYNKVILHVFLVKDVKRAVNRLEQIVPALDLGGSEFRSFWETHDVPTTVTIKELPGACGLFLTENKYQKIRNLVFQASEQRLIDKSNHYLKVFREALPEDPEDLLFHGICKSVGYSAYAELFAKLAEVYPYSEIKKLFRSLHRQSRVEVLGRWLGFIGILDSIDSAEVHDDLRREWMAFLQFRQRQGIALSAETPSPKSPSRPLNNPLRRLTGLYYHLQKVHFQGLFKSWLKFFEDCRQEMKNIKKCLPGIMKLLEDIFPQPDWDPLNHLIIATGKPLAETKLRLIGRERQLIILVNGIIPFFLAWAKYHNNKELEKELFALFLILPAEGKNRKTRFMEQRLFQIHPQFKVKKNLSYHQGLIQLHDDCCRSFYQGCDNCSLIKMIR